MDILGEQGQRNSENTSASTPKAPRFPTFCWWNCAQRAALARHATSQPPGP
ncbi:hypothetical protein AB0D37_32440 [Streptomyces sp. NPDC048384]|uniref:hypothetical protein n=1 Tax=Streptomyces sp. NPDC048384 TaxID=3155487 RepID=UPI0034380DFD